MKTFVISVSIAVGILGGLYLMLPSLSLGSVEIGSSYRGTTITSDNASSTAVTELRDGVGTLGSVTITATSTPLAYSVKIYDATSTMATSSAEVVAEFDYSNDLLGTYTFDLEVQNGISVEAPASFDGWYVVTWRPE